MIKNWDVSDCKIMREIWEAR